VTTTGTSGIWQLIKERRTRDALYHAKDYWDARTNGRSGMARCMWTSNAFNEMWDERQKVLFARNLGPLAGRRVVDVGCGTGRLTRWFASQGAAECVGIDFSPASVDAAVKETEGTELAARYAVGDVVAGMDDVGVGAFDDAVTVSCLAVACRDAESLERAMRNVARLVRRGGRVALLEPIHRFPPLRRILDLGVEDWIAIANRAGLALLGADRMGFVPVRALFSVRDVPRAILAPIFRGAERLLDAAPYLAPTADYKLLVFKVQGD
jgi:SAM-dependent methyltransferase